MDSRRYALVDVGCSFLAAWLSRCLVFGYLDPWAWCDSQVRLRSLAGGDLGVADGPQALQIPSYAPCREYIHTHLCVYIHR